MGQSLQLGKVGHCAPPNLSNSLLGHPSSLDFPVRSTPQTFPPAEISLSVQGIKGGRADKRDYDL
jgi:hypothetical protein